VPDGLTGIEIRGGQAKIIYVHGGVNLRTRRAFCACNTALCNVTGGLWSGDEGSHSVESIKIGMAVSLTSY
jgi:hypothetical protein